MGVHEMHQNMVRVNFNSTNHNKFAAEKGKVAECVHTL